MVNKSKSKSDVAAAELREKLAKLEAQQTVLGGALAGEMAKLTATIVGTLTVELAKVQREVIRNREDLQLHRDSLMAAVNVLAGDIRKLQQTADMTFGHVVSEASFPTTPIVPAGQPAAPEPAPKTNGEKPLLPRLTPELVPAEGEHLIEYVGEMGIAKTGNHTVKMRFQGTEYVYFLNEQRNTIIKERTQRGVPVHVKRGVWDKEPTIEFLWR